MSFPNAAELARNLTSYLVRNDDMVNRWGNAVSSYLELPGLVGFWPMSSVQRSTGNAYDLSGQGRTLTYNGNPTYNIYNNFIPYIDFDGTGDYLTRPDETDLDILGTETIYNSSVRGLTIGGWFYVNARVGTSEIYFSKWQTGARADMSYALWELAVTNNLTFSVGNGVTSFDAINTNGIPLQTWEFWVGRYTPSTEVKLWQNLDTVVNVAGIPASIFNSNANLTLGGLNAGLFLVNARTCLNFLCANALPDVLVESLFQQSRVLFGV